MKNEMNKDKALGWTRITIADSSEPALYRVSVHNDDFTPMEFVIDILEKIFYLERQKAIEIMLKAHTTGKADCGRFTKDVAETKISQAIEYARMHEHPLFCSMEAV